MGKGAISLSVGHVSTKNSSDFAPRSPVCFISTHLDDVVLSCSHFLAQHPGAVVATVCAGAPDGPAGLWDRLTTGHASARQALSQRRDEDAEALRRLGASPMWLELFDGQYQSSPLGPLDQRDRGPIAAAVADVLDRLVPAAVVAPVGLFHPDHIAVSDACLLLARERPEDYYLYVDMPYARVLPLKLDERLRQLDVAVHELAPFQPVDPAEKRRAVDAYTSQLRWVRGAAAGSFEPSMTDCERYWRVACPAS